jgi:hypothetical protein
MLSSAAMRAYSWHFHSSAPAGTLGPHLRRFAEALRRTGIVLAVIPGWMPVDMAAPGSTVLVRHVLAEPVKL